MTNSGTTLSESWLGVRPDERKLAYGAFAALLGITAAHTLLETARDAIFLARLPATRLPWMYLSVAIAGIGLSELDRRVGTRAHRTFGVTPFLVGGSIITAAFSLVDGAGTLGLYAMYVWTALFASWATLQFSLVLSAALTVEQAKRIFGFIGAGSILGAVVGGAAARALVVRLPPSAMVLGAAVVFALTGLGPARMVSKGMQGPVVGGGATRSSLSGAGQLVKHPYGRLLLVLLLASSIALTVADYLFKSQVRASMPPEALASFFATVQVVFSAISLLVQLLVVPFVLRSIGAHGAMLVLPVLLSIGAVGLQAGVGLFGALLLRGADGSLRYSLHRTGLDVLYLPLSDPERRRLKPVLETLGQRGGQALAAVLLLILVSKPIAVPVLVLVVTSMLWVGAVGALRAPYIQLFRSSLERGTIGTPAELPRLDLPALESAVVALNSAKDGEVSLALDLLATHREGKLVPALILYHPSAEVVLHALDVFARLRRDDILPILDRLHSHPSSSVRAAALRCRSTIAPDEGILRAALEEGCPDTAATALVGLLTHGWMHDDEMESRLATLLDEATSEVLVALARAVAVQPDTRARAVLLACAKSTDVVVLDETASAMACSPDEAFIPDLISMLARHGSREAARKALVALGKPALTALHNVLVNPASPHVLRRHIPESLRRFAPEQVAPMLLQQLKDERDGMVRFKVIRSLNRMRVEAPSLVLDTALIEDLMDRTFRSAFKLVELRVALLAGANDDARRKTAAQMLLIDVLHDKEVHAVERALRLINLMLPGEDLRSVIRAVTGTRPRSRASAVEVLEALTPAGYRDAVLAMVRDIPDTERLERAGSYFASRKLTYETALLALLEDGGTTLRALGAYHAAEIELEIPVEVPGSIRSGRRSAAVDELLRAVELAPVSRRPVFQ